ncbi:MAG: ABC transporter permease [Acetobacteraceae bacterium]
MKLRPAAPFLLLAPAFLFFVVLFVFPELRMLALSLGVPHWSLHEYTRFLGDPYYRAVLFRSLLFGALVTLVTLVLGLPLAWRLARLESRLAPFLLILSTFPLWISAVVRSFGWIVILGRGGPISGALYMLGLVQPSFQLLYTLSGVVIALAQVLLPFMVLSLYSVIRAIDPELERAAQNLGASPLAAGLLTTLPLARGGILSGSLIVFALSISAFATPSLVGGARVQLMATTIYEQMTELADWKFATAVAFILLAIVLVITLVYSRFAEGPGELPGR